MNIRQRKGQQQNIQVTYLAGGNKVKGMIKTEQEKREKDLVERRNSTSLKVEFHIILTLHSEICSISLTPLIK